MKKRFVPVDSQSLFLSLLIPIVTLLFRIDLAYQALDPLFNAVIGHTLSGRNVAFRAAVLFIVGLCLIALLYLFFRCLSRLLDFYTHRLPFWIILLLTLLSPLPLFRIAAWMRPILDDFIFLTIHPGQTLLGTIVNQYQTWSGRYMTYPVSWLSGWIPYHQFVIGLPVAVYLLSTAGASVLAYFLFQTFETRRPLTKRLRVLISILAGVCLVTGSYVTAPSIFSSIYWFAGAVVYGVGIAASLLAFAAIFAANRTNPPRKLYIVLALLCIFIACGTNELTAISMVVLSFATLLYALLFDREQRGRITPFALLFAAALIFTAISFAAPGNFIRANLITGEKEGNFLETLFGVILPGTNAIFIYFLEEFAEKFGILLCLFLAFLILGTQFFIPARTKGTLVWVMLACVLAAYASFASNGAIQWAPERTLIIPAFWLLIALAALGLLLGSLLCPRRDAANLTFTGLLVVCILGIYLSANFYAANAQKSRQFAAEADFRENMLLEKRQESKTVEACVVGLLFDELPDLESNPGFYVNQAMADYYGLEALTATARCADLMNETTTEHP